MITYQCRNGLGSLSCDICPRRTFTIPGDIVVKSHFDNDRLRLHPENMSRMIIVLKRGITVEDINADYSHLLRFPSASAMSRLHSFPRSINSNLSRITDRHQVYLFDQETHPVGSVFSGRLMLFDISCHSWRMYRNTPELHPSIFIALFYKATPHSLPMTQIRVQVPNTLLTGTSPHRHVSSTFPSTPVKTRVGLRRSSASD